ncbi:hypothetical protein Tco_0931297 [Tanacetum coccineum]
MVRRDLVGLVWRWPELKAPPPSQPLKGHPQLARSLSNNHVIMKRVKQVQVIPLLAAGHCQLVKHVLGKVVRAKETVEQSQMHHTLIRTHPPKECQMLV